ncbi:MULTISPECIES: DUF167 family protein [Sphingosinicellaceae]|uniref:DUF167 family protein n=1 Tax=Sphingosinicellaceae TaxID=2820280 RepID=UPI001C1DE1A3|nr:MULTISPECIES: DUF167 family protein [Polymorphobacter]QYE35322.1 DUF167 domain-containing protein [Polymorphobacter sp. PAMC 29334]UAJ11373.1 DUF167 family protein [Polymorphobacter megasporae]
MTLSVRVSPRAGRNAVEGLLPDAEGKLHLGVRVAAAPVDGEANDAVEATLARWLGIKPREVEVTGGLTARSKVVTIDGDPVALIRKLQTLTAPKVTA